MSHREEWLHTNCAWFLEAQKARALIRDMRNGLATCNPRQVVYALPAWSKANEYLRQWHEGDEELQP